MQIQAHGATDIGRVRRHNEDHFLIDGVCRLYLVCDGMGGHAAGDVAARSTADTVREVVMSNAALLRRVSEGKHAPDAAAQVLSRAIQLAGERIHRMAQQDRRRTGMGTTCTALLVLGGKGVMGHVGDSRLYLARGGQIYQLSEDHTFLHEALKRGMLTPEEAEVSTHRNIVTRAVGPKPSVLVDTLVFDILPGDTLLLCSDGLHQYVSEPDELAEALRSERNGDVAARLIDAAKERGGTDNITAVVLNASARPTDEKEQSARASRVQAELSALGHILLFRELDMKELVQVLNVFRPLECAVDQEVVREGEKSATLFVLVSGSAIVSRRGRDLALLRAGDHFGEMALLNRAPRSATVRIRQPGRLLAADGASFHQLIQKEPVIGAKFLWRLAQTLSCRLDDLYLHHDPSAPSGHELLLDQTTQTYGLFPSPFDR